MMLSARRKNSKGENWTKYSFQHNEELSVKTNRNRSRSNKPSFKLNREEEEKIQILKEGVELTKKNPIGSHKRVLWISPDLQEVFWSRDNMDKNEPRKKISSADIIEVTLEKNTKTGAFGTRYSRYDTLFVGTISGRVLELTSHDSEVLDKCYQAFEVLKQRSVPLVSPPKELKHVLQVDEDFHWEADKPIDQMIQLEKLLGQGSYGKVYKGVLQQHLPIVFAVKIIEVKKGRGLKDIKNEIDILKKCRHKNICGYYGYGVPKKSSNDKHNTEKLWLLMDFCGAGAVGDMLKRLKKDKISLTEDQIAYILASMLEGLIYLHGQNIWHADIKAANVLLSLKGVPKVADFGVSQILTPTNSNGHLVGNETHRCSSQPRGSPLWMAPEVLSGRECDSKADIWSIGITAIELANGEVLPPPGTKGIHQVIRAVCNGPPPRLNDKFSNNLRDFVSQCVVKDPKKRPSASELLCHNFFLRPMGPYLLAPLIDRPRSRSIINSILPRSSPRKDQLCGIDSDDFLELKGLEEKEIKTRSKWKHLTCTKVTLFIFLFLLLIAVISDYEFILYQLSDIRLFSV